MSYSQNLPAFGKSSRSTSAEFAGPPIAPCAISASGRQRGRLPLFAQFPPAALFKAIGRAVARRAVARPPASGTVIAMCGVVRPAHNSGRPWRVIGGP